MSQPSRAWLVLTFAWIALVAGQQQCYFGPGAANRGPAELVPCLDDGQSACCLLGDVCLSGNACWNDATGDTYQYGCTDITYESEVCPYKCGFNTTKSPWTALEYCKEITGTWACHAPESCGCTWNFSYGLVDLTNRGCKAMGTDARVALYAPADLAPYVLLPSSYGGTTSYYTTYVTEGSTTWVTTAIAGYTPSSIGPWTVYQAQPTSVVLIEPDLSPSPSTVAAAQSTTPTASSSSQVSSPASTTMSPSTIVSSSTTMSPSTTVSLSTSIPSPAPGLSNGAKAGIGVGITGSACFIAAIAAAVFMRRKNRRQRAAQAQQAQQAQQYSQGPPQMQSMAPYYQPHEKPPGWQGPYSPPGAAHMPAMYYDSNQTPPYHDQYRHPSTGYAEHAPKVSMSPPLELSAEGRVHEIGSDGAGISPMPSPRPVPLTPTPASAEAEPLLK